MSQNYTINIEYHDATTQRVIISLCVPSSSGRPSTLSLNPIMRLSSSERQYIYIYIQITSFVSTLLFVPIWTFIYNFCSTRRSNSVSFKYFINFRYRSHCITNVNYLAYKILREVKCVEKKYMPKCKKIIQKQFPNRDNLLYYLL